MKQHQENMIVKGAFGKKIDSTMAIFALKNIAGWRDKQEFEHTGPNGEALSGPAPVNIKIITVEATRTDSKEAPTRTVVVEESCPTSP